MGQSVMRGRGWGSQSREEGGGAASDERNGVGQPVMRGRGWGSQ